MKSLKIKLVAALFLAAAAASPAVADPDPAMYCDCIHRCDKLYVSGTPQHANCVFNCETAWGPAMCAAADIDTPADRR